MGNKNQEVQKRPNNIKYKSGDIYGNLLITGKSFRGNNGVRYVEAICDCGHIGFHRLKGVVYSKIKSCGCKTEENRMLSLTVHGFNKVGNRHPIYKAWDNMKDRCYNNNYNSYHNYGGRGIIVCAEWVNDFITFCKWAIVNEWKKGLSLDRINTDGNYEPQNCRWATDIQQGRNRRNNYNIEAFGEKKCLSAWAEDIRCLVNAPVVQRRLTVLKWDSERAISTPKKYKKELLSA